MRRHGGKSTTTFTTQLGYNAGFTLQVNVSLRLSCRRVTRLPPICDRPLNHKIGCPRKSVRSTAWESIPTFSCLLAQHAFWASRRESSEASNHVACLADSISASLLIVEYPGNTSSQGGVAPVRRILIQWRIVVMINTVRGGWRVGGGRDRDVQLE